MITSYLFVLRPVKALFAKMVKTKYTIQTAWRYSAMILGLFFALLLLSGNCTIRQFILSNKSETTHRSNENLNLSFQKKGSKYCCSLTQEAAFQKATPDRLFDSENSLSRPSFVSEFILQAPYVTFSEAPLFGYASPSLSDIPRFLKHRILLI